MAVAFGTVVHVQIAGREIRTAFQRAESPALYRTSVQIIHPIRQRAAELGRFSWRGLLVAVLPGLGDAALVVVEGPGSLSDTSRETFQFQGARHNRGSRRCQSVLVQDELEC